MNFVRMPEYIGLMEEKQIYLEGKTEYICGDVKIVLSLKDDVLTAELTAEKTPVREVILGWERMAGKDSRVLGDHWERGYGDLGWKKPEESGVMPWYFMEDQKDCCLGYGVKVRPGAMCWWEIKGQDVLLHLDVRCGGEGVILNGRTLKMAEILMKRYETEDTFAATQQFCGSMCTDSISRPEPVYGSNNWYYAYGVSSREDILRDTAYLASMTEGLENRPYMVIDDGWQSHHTASYNGGPWREGNADYGDMGQLAADMKAYNVKPGIWFRPLYDRSHDVPEHWHMKRFKTILDISVPEVLEHVKEDVRRICDWGYELIKHDFSTCDIFGRWGFDMGSELTTDNWHFADTSRTTAEIIVAFYRAIKEAAGDVLILGCNCIGHLGAGLMEANRTGDDTSGIEWERTKKMGVNTLAFRMPQHGTFFGADADCVGITEHIAWEKNRQWMDVLSSSGTPFFVSVKPGLLNAAQEEELKAAYQKAAVNTQIAVPLDWKETEKPQEWRTFEGIKRFTW